MKQPPCRSLRHVANNPEMRPSLLFHRIKLRYLPNLDVAIKSAVPP
jgi:hypothetical protein